MEYKVFNRAQETYTRAYDAARPVHMGIRMLASRAEAAAEKNRKRRRMGIECERRRIEQATKRKKHFKKLNREPNGEEEEGDNDREALEKKKNSLIHYGTRREHIFVRRRHIQFFPRFFSFFSP